MILTVWKNQDDIISNKKILYKQISEKNIKKKKKRKKKKKKEKKEKRKKEERLKTFLLTENNPALLQCLAKRRKRRQNTLN